MDKKEFYNLLDKYIAGAASKDEEQRLLNFYGSFKPSNTESELPDMESLKNKIFDKISEKINPEGELKVSFKLNYFRSFSIAATILVALSIGFYFYSIRTLPLEEQFVELNVKEQVFDLAKTSIVQAAWNNGQDLTIHGWAYGLNSGFVTDLNVNFSSDEDLDKVYQLKF